LLKKEILRKNLDEAFDHILILLPFTESTSYNEPANSSFCKTIIIYTASIVEALLFHLLDNNFSEKDIAEFYSKWELIDRKVLFKVNLEHEIVAGDYKKILGKSRKDKMNLSQITNFLEIHKIITHKLSTRIDQIRIIRNEQHIGSSQKVNTYSKSDLEDAFSIAREVKDFVKVNAM